MSAKRTLPIDELVQRYLQGASLRELGRQYDVDHKIISSRLKRSGIIIRPRRTDPVERFNRFVHQSADPDACWGWKGFTNSFGYGKFNNGTKVPTSAHRFAYLRFVGPIPPETPHVLHKCDNPPCSNPRHLFLGTHADNMADMAAKGRGTSRPRPSQQGERHHLARLTQCDVDAIRAQFAAGDATKADLARVYGVSRQHIRRIVQWGSWGHNEH